MFGFPSLVIISLCCIPVSLVSSFELILTTPLQFQLCFAAVAVQDSRLKSMHRIQNLEMKRGERRKN